MRRFISDHLAVPVSELAIILMACLLLAHANGCALFNPPKDLTPAEKRAMQIASVEDQLNNATKNATKAYLEDKTLTAEQFVKVADLDREARKALVVVKVVSESGDVSTFDGKLMAVRELLNQLILSRDNPERTTP